MWELIASHNTKNLRLVLFVDRYTGAVFCTLEAASSSRFDGRFQDFVLLLSGPKDQESTGNTDSKVRTRCLPARGWAGSEGVERVVLGMAISANRDKRPFRLQGRTLGKTIYATQGTEKTIKKAGGTSYSQER